MDMKDQVKGWLKQAEQESLNIGTAVFDDYYLLARATAYGLKTRGSAYIAMTPGNGSAYDIVITLVDEVGKRRLGGDMVVALPHFGSVWTLQSTQDHHPTYIAEKFHVGMTNATVVAVLLTLISEQLSEGSLRCDPISSC